MRSMRQSDATIAVRFGSWYNTGGTAAKRLPERSTSSSREHDESSGGRLSWLRTRGNVSECWCSEPLEVAVAEAEVAPMAFVCAYVCGV